LDAARLQLTRTPKALPVMRMAPDVTRLEDFRFEHFTLENYHPDPHIKAAVAV
jgi:thymidylate synthase